jgi:hypothetical protein
LIEMLLASLEEAIHGPADSKFTWFNSNEPGSGMEGVMKTLTAEQASRPPTSGGRTIAAHVAHATFHLVASAAWLNGDKSAADWDSSWEPAMVDEAGWARLRESLEQAHTAVADAIRRRQEWDNLGIGGGIGAVAHAAYHLGAIRQIIRIVDQNAAGSR